MNSEFSFIRVSSAFISAKPRNESSRGDFCYFESSRLRVESEFIASSNLVSSRVRIY